MADETLKLVWVDLEMTGLDPETDAILEIAVIITGPDLQPIAEMENVIWQPPKVLSLMSPFVRKMHTDNGLLEKVAASEVDLRGAERNALALVSEHCKLGEGVLAGNSIYQDRRFLTRYMPAFEGFLHYRQVDVSSIKVLAQSWFKDTPKHEKKNQTHTALADIRQSLDELQYYKDQIFKSPLKNSD
jgi:oligoribonuclease